MDVEIALTLMISFGMLIAFIMSEKNDPSYALAGLEGSLSHLCLAPLDGVWSYCNRSMLAHGAVFNSV
ncbi:hypothetical protein DCC39_11600 [Pueribacillus theae]|uniref:Uncharacterized protein n=1 Tax=Pueribacillus theae TaxID=2171751 RepID=A0A2U1JYY0_9BACI|nr:hypothetical protein [Pueribacillus theae]PWA10352.1 hypothetical protein DCC39_11600 [Pueribacillus theae]